MMRRTLTSGLVALLLIFAMLGCRRETPAPSEAKVELAFSPSPPAVGSTEVTLTLANAVGQPLTDAAVELEGNMNHAGMKPSFARLAEAGPGRYTGTIEFTMGGDWFVLVTATMPDGKVIERKIDVPGVRTP